MIREELWEAVLLDPYEKGGSHLYVVSGYASAAMAFRHFEQAANEKNPLVINLIIGMAGREGIPLADHLGFQQLSEKFPGRFHCSYYAGDKPVHAKLYAWYMSGIPHKGYLASANYTNSGFCGNLQEAAEACDPKAIYDFYSVLLEKSISCTDNQAETLIDIYIKHSKKGQMPLGMREPDLTYHSDDLEILETASTSFLTRPGDNEIPQTSGLNWGQREGREPNQAYIPVRAPLNQSGFFPPKETIFTLIADNGTTLFCTRAQEDAKAIETPENNSILGRYFRERIGVPLGEPVKLVDLQRYGRTNIDFYKISDDSFYMDFSVEDGS